jgi:hypothetical protein
MVSAATASVVSAAPGQNNNPPQNPGQNGQNFTATPELDSIFLLGSGLAGLVGYAALRRRARR